MHVIKIRISERKKKNRGKGRRCSEKDSTPPSPPQRQVGGAHGGLGGAFSTRRARFLQL